MVEWKYKIRVKEVYEYHMEVVVEESGCLDEVERILEGDMKWDGCCNFQFYPDREHYAHICNLKDYAAIFTELEEIRNHYFASAP